MGLRKLYIELRKQPIDGDSFVYDIYVNQVKLQYTSALDFMIVVFKDTPTLALEVQIGDNLTDTIDNLLTQLQTYFTELGNTTGSFLTDISYLRIGDLIEVSISSSAITNIINFWKMGISGDNIIIRTETPCNTYFLNNSNVVGVSEFIYSLPNGSYYFKGLTTGETSYFDIPYGFRFPLNRDTWYGIFTTSNELILGWKVYKSLEIENVVTSINNNQLTIIITGIDYLNLSNYTYSIDGINFSTSNIFDDVPTGLIEITILDSLGCKKTFEATNTGTTNGNTYEPYLHISESNSIRFVDRVEHQNCGNYKNVFNTLSCEETTSPANTFIQLAQTCDNRKTQVLTSYDNLEVYAKIVNENDTTEITATKIVNNIGIQDKRDCTYFNYNNKLAIIYITGNIYSYGTSDVIETYQLNGNLPEYGQIGTWLETDYGVCQIENIILLDNGNKALIMNVNILIDTEVNGKVQVIYNRDTYNIWEFDIDFSLFENKTITIGVRAYQNTPDINFPEKIKVSEKIQVKQRWERSKEIIWFNSKNTDIYFYSGIQMQNRLNFVDINTQVQDGSIEVEKTDSEVISIDAINYNSVELEILYLSTGMVRKILLALKHDNLIIEKVPYKCVESPEINRLGKSNFYNLKAKLTEAGDVWNQGTANTQVIYSNVEMIGLQQGDLESEYLRIL